jgi:hypothetical protein
VKINFFHRLLAVTLLVAALPLFVSGLWAQAPEAPEPPKGDLWEVVSQVTIVGMPFAMPAQKAKVCAAREWTQPPAPENEERNCVSSNFVRHDDGKVTWTSVCEDGMTGEGEITRENDDAYTGELRYSSPDGNIVIQLSGTRIDECDNPQ